MNSRVSYAVYQIREMILSACEKGTYPTYEGMRRLNPQFGSNHKTFARVRRLMVAEGLVLPRNSRQRNAEEPAKADSSPAEVAPCGDQAVSRSGDGLINKKPWRPIWAANWPDAQISRLRDILDAVHDFRAAWRRLHRPFKDQNIIGLNRDQHKQRPPRITNDRWGNPIERYLDAPASHPRGQGI